MDKIEIVPDTPEEELKQTNAGLLRLYQRERELAERLQIQLRGMRTERANLKRRVSDQQATIDGLIRERDRREQTLCDTGERLRRIHRAFVLLKTRPGFGVKEAEALAHDIEEGEYTPD